MRLLDFIKEQPRDGHDVLNVRLSGFPSLASIKELSLEMRHRVYKTLIRPCFAYAARIWANEEPIN